MTTDKLHNSETPTFLLYSRKLVLRTHTYTHTGHRNTLKTTWQQSLVKDIIKTAADQAKDRPKYYLLVY